MAAQPGFQVNAFKVFTTDGRNVVLVDPVDYLSLDGTWYRMEAGTTSDGGSTPKIAWSLGITPFGKWWKPYVFHDRNFRSSTLSFDKCNDLLWESMQLQGFDGPEDEAKAMAIVEAVRKFGLQAFNQDRGITT